MSHKRLKQWWLVPDNPRPRQPKEGNIVAGIHLHNPISSRGQWCQDASVEKAQFQLRNAMHRQCVWHLVGYMGSTRQESRRAILVYGGYLFEYYRSWDRAARHAGRPKNWSSESCWMHIWLARPSLRQEVDLVYSTTNRQCSSRCRFDDLRSQRGALGQNWGAPAMGYVPNGIGYIWKYLCRLMFRGYVRHLQSNYHRRARNRVQRGAFMGHLPIGMIPFWSCPVHAWVVDPSRFSFAG